MSLAAHPVIRLPCDYADRRPLVGANLLLATQAVMSLRRNQIARPHRSGGLPAVKTICSSARIAVTSCGRISGRRDSCFERVRDDPDGLRTCG